LLGSRFDHCRVGAEEGRRGTGDFAAINGEVDAEMMALDAPAPAAGLRRRAVNGHEIPARVAHHRAALLQVMENRFQAHDGRRLLIAVRTQPRAQKVHRGRLLVGIQLFEAHAFASRLLVAILQGNEMPIEALLVVEGEDCLGLLLGH
jgi:hypothetical protein